MSFLPSGRGAGPAAGLVWSVSGLLVATGDALQARFGAVTVRGELSGVTRAASGHCYFNLKDDGSGGGGPASLRCAMFRRAASLVAVPLREGLQVELRGRLAIYEARGELQMIVEALQPVGAGNLYEQFLRLKAKLAAEGLFDADRKRALPAFPRRVGVVTSLAGAALHDVVATLQRRAPHVELLVYPSLVQGPEAPAALVAALAAAAARDEVDVLMVCRGGGSMEDLWAFNDEAVIRAMARLPMPVISGVGHETDTTLADLVADLRAATPTAAAETVAPGQAALLAELGAQAARMQRRVGHRLDTAAQRIDNLALRLARPGQALGRTRAGLQAAELRLAQALQQRLQSAARQLDASGTRLLHAGERQRERRAQALARAGDALAALDPRRVLERGYAWVQDGQGAPLVSVAGLAAGDRVTAVLRDGRAELRVEDIQPLPPAPASA